METAFYFYLELECASMGVARKIIKTFGKTALLPKADE